MFKSITIIGNLGADPEIATLPSGTLVGKFSVACNEKWTDRETGETNTRTEWFRVVAYQSGETGLVTNLIQKWLRKGQLVYLQGDPSQRKFQDRETGADRYTFEIKLGPQSVIKMLGGRAENGHDAEAKPATNGAATPPPNTEAGDPGFEKAPF